MGEEYVFVYGDKIDLVSQAVGYVLIFFLMKRRPPRSTQSRSSAASDVYKRQLDAHLLVVPVHAGQLVCRNWVRIDAVDRDAAAAPVSYTHLRAHETPEHLVCRLLLEKTNDKRTSSLPSRSYKDTRVHVCATFHV